MTKIREPAAEGKSDDLPPLSEIVEEEAEDMCGMCEDIEDEPEPEEVDALVTSITSLFASSVKDVLATVTANKLKDKTLGCGWSQGPKKPIPGAKARLSREEMMKVHPCSVCLKFGHWSRE